MARSKHELRCFCSRRPLLAMYGLDKFGRTYVHIKAYKQRRIYTDVIHYGGEVNIRCRECFRWNNIVFTTPAKDHAVLQESAPPAELDNPDILIPMKS